MPAHRFAALLVSLALLPGCAYVAGQQRLERRFEKSFTVGAQTRITVRVPGGSIRLRTIDGPTAGVTLTAKTRGASDADLEARLADYEVVLTQEGDMITASAKSKPVRTRSWQGLSFDAEVTVPAGVIVDLQTSGGDIEVDGQRTAAITAQTSGGSITVAGSSGTVHVETSGGDIRVGRADTRLSARTSGGDVTVDDVSGRAEQVDVSTSGGDINVTVDPAASLRISGTTSGGSARLEGFPIEAQPTRRRSQAEGTINGGRGTLRAHTSGGDVTIRAR